jgi:hypothetical protein
MAEWSKAAVLKTVDPLRGPWVRIPLPPHCFLMSITKALEGYFLFPTTCLARCREDTKARAALVLFSTPC